MKNYHAFKIKFIGPTNYRGARVKIISDRFHQSITISYDYTYDNIVDIGADWLLKQGFNLIGQAETKEFSIIFSDTFKPMFDNKAKKIKEKEKNYE